ncbi:MAG: hypothetical protein JNJ71_15505 [Rubrivivax sp.]|nr:hypothetical protein [Rubrivivax sp.]
MNTRPPSLTVPEDSAGGDIPTLDWLGEPVDCTRCEHQALRESGGCELGRSCMQDAYARRIDRFFRTHPELAVQHLKHAYFEVRAIAARWVDVFQLPSLLTDPDETVRLQVALRIPERWLLRMRQDPHREVRIRVAMRLAEGELLPLRDDPDYQVRTMVARRLPSALLASMIEDRDDEVRREVARRVGMPALMRLAADPSPDVRRIVANRLPEPLLHLLDGDEDVIVAHTLAERRGATAPEQDAAATTRGPHAPSLAPVARATSEKHHG